MVAPPALNRRIIEAQLEVDLPRAGDQHLLLLYGRYDDVSSPAEFVVRISERQRRITVTDQQSVLGIIDAWQAHQSAHAGSDDVLVVTTPIEDSQLGWDLRGYAVGRASRTVDRVEVVKQRFGAVDVDPRVRREAWLVEALLDAEPATGWQRSGQVLTRDAAVRALIGARLGGEELAEGSLDAGALLTWSRSPRGPAAFTALPEAEQAGLSSWLAETVGDAAGVLMSLASAGRASDAMAIGILGAAVVRPGSSTETALAVGGLLGSVRPRPTELRVFVDAVEGTLERWIDEASSGSPQGYAVRDRVLDVVQRADKLAESANLTDALTANRFLPSSLNARLRDLVRALTPKSRSSTLSAESALNAVLDHRLIRLHEDRKLAAETAVRIARWLTEPDQRVESVADGVRLHLADLGWVDRALSVLTPGDAAQDPQIDQAYRVLHGAARARRDRLDSDFADRLAPWARNASTQSPGGCLLIEDVLEQIAVPLAGQDQAPLIVVLDGMSSAVAIELGEQLSTRAWLEASPQAGARIAAVSAIPSVTRVSRACLLTGALNVGDQQLEKAGFAAFWRKHRVAAELFHKGQLAGPAGQRLSEPLVAAIAGDGVVGVVLNTIDDALDRGREGGRTAWRVKDVTYLQELLDAARGYGRPVVLVADHGHVLDHSAEGSLPVAVDGVESVRWRTGTPGQGEVSLSGPRVLYGEGEVVVPWREDIRYMPRKAGYHGGASLAEMTIPILILLPSAGLLPSGWQLLSTESVQPVWWNGGASVVSAPVVSGPAKKKPTKVSRPVEEESALFVVTPPEPTLSATLGTEVVSSGAYAAQRALVPKAPNKPEIAAVIDALAAADGKLSLGAIARPAGRAGRNPEFLAITLQRLLNVEGYPVLSLVDGGRTVRLDLQLLREQFGVGKP